MKNFSGVITIESDAGSTKVFANSVLVCTLHGYAGEDLVDSLIKQKVIQAAQAETSLVIA